MYEQILSKLQELFPNLTPLQASDAAQELFAVYANAQPVYEAVGYTTITMADLTGNIMSKMGGGWSVDKLIVTPLSNATSTPVTTVNAIIIYKKL